MPRRIPDFPDIYWSWNYISSVGSLVSVFGVFVFFWLIADMYLYNSLFFQIKNNYYIIILNNWFIEHTSYFSFTKNTYVFTKYNFFSTYNKSYIFLDRFILSSFLKIVHVIIKPFIVFNNYLTLEHINENFILGSGNWLIVQLLSLIQGWISIFMAFFISKKQGLFLLKVTFYNLIIQEFLKSLPSQITLLFQRIIRENKLINLL